VTLAQALFMVAKFGLILLVAVFGALLFVLGLLMPQSVRLPVIRVAQELTPPHGKSAPQTSPQSHASNPASTGAQQPAAAPAPIPYRQLIIPTPLPLDGQYALQLGLYPAASNATAWVERAQAAGVPATTIDVVDESGHRWIAVAAGQYALPDDARAARISLTRTLTLAQALPVIRMPAKPAAATSAAP
jgi:hypothetical protein